MLCENNDWLELSKTHKTKPLPDFVFDFQIIFVDKNNIYVTKTRW